MHKFYLSWYYFYNFIIVHCRLVVINHNTYQELRILSILITESMVAGLQLILIYYLAIIDLYVIFCGWRTCGTLAKFQRHVKYYNHRIIIKKMKNMMKEVNLKYQNTSK